MVISFIMEEAGVRTGLVFGHYHYSDLLGHRLGHVPLLIPLGWFMMVYRPGWWPRRCCAAWTCVGRPAWRPWPSSPPWP
ncbi:MAG: carotenoid biosynthesis protein [Caulobacteraceae bacterium]